jgi:predicted DNA-binding antitoxin AbrB/MazE fold protein
MPDTLRAIYRNGAFVPVVPCDLPEETEVQVVVQNGAEMIPPLESDPIRRGEIKKRLLQRMSNSPLPPDAPKLTRDQFHERGCYERLDLCT